MDRIAQRPIISAARLLQRTRRYLGSFFAVLRGFEDFLSLLVPSCISVDFSPQSPYLGALF